jgi:glutathione S-transferase
MRRLVQLLLAPPSRFARLLVAEKRLTCDCVAPENLAEHLPVFIDLDGTRCEGLWAIVDHLEGAYADHPLAPEDDEARRESLRLLDWAMGPFLENVTKRIVYERASQRYTGAAARRAPDMDTVRTGREALRAALATLGASAERNGYLTTRDCTLGDLAVAAHLSAIDYFGEVPWTEFPAAAEWYMRMKSRPSFRNLLADRVPGQPPVSHYADLDA